MLPATRNPNPIPPHPGGPHRCIYFDCGNTPTLACWIRTTAQPGQAGDWYDVCQIHAGSVLGRWVVELVAGGPCIEMLVEPEANYPARS